MSTKNIVIFGQTGTGKSSVVNLMAGKEIANTSIETQRCTLHWTEHPIVFDGHSFKVFDTVGMEDHQLEMAGYLSAIENTYRLITKLQNEGGIHLLLFCVRAGRFTSTTQNNYRLFYESLCEKQVPIVLVVTGLEGEQNMDGWWTRSKPTFDKYGVVVDDHACITAIKGLDHREQQLYEESRHLVRKLIIQHSKDASDGYNGSDGHSDKGHNGGHGWFRRVLGMLKGLLGGLLPRDTPKRKDIVSVFVKRCGMPPEAAAELAKQISPQNGLLDKLRVF